MKPKLTRKVVWVESFPLSSSNPSLSLDCNLQKGLEHEKQELIPLLK